MSSEVATLHTYPVYSVPKKGTLYIHALAHYIVSQVKSITTLIDVGVTPINELLELKMLLLDIASSAKLYRYIKGLAPELSNAMGRDLIKASTLISRSYLTQVLVKAFKALQKNQVEELKDAIMDLATVLDLNFEKAPTATKILSKENICEVSSLLALLIALSMRIEGKGA